MNFRHKLLGNLYSMEVPLLVHSQLEIDLWSSRSFQGKQNGIHPSLLYERNFTDNFSPLVVKIYL
jgi:hypothetical protein